MQDNKKIKDPVYGYILIPTEYIKNIIDTAPFQRLRRVIQTSYSPLYSSALHNRFVHSLGVLHLGQIVAERLEKVIVEKGYVTKQKAVKYAKVYKLACLLHDVGHAPFSHTGEIYYKTDKFKADELHNRLCELVSKKQFKKDLPFESDSAAPHEIMSAIVGIKEFGNLIGDQESKELFARCITGYEYKVKTVENEIKNCFIGMLNSKVIDVDRLDYLIRDAYTSGFATISIDYVRLLNSLTIVKHEEKYRIAYLKDAVSVIENVVYAHDAERKWIQNHPVVLYEAYIIKRMLEHLNGKLDGDNKKLFSEQSLSCEGHELNSGIRVSLLCDDDIVYLSKNIFKNEFADEFFDRTRRRNPVWKSEAEYRAYIGEISTGGDHETDFIECMRSFNASRVPEHSMPMIINEALIEKLQKELEDAQKKEPEKNRKQIRAIERQLCACRYLNNYVKQRDLPFDFVIIPTSMFNSNFSKKHLKEVLIAFGECEGDKVLKLEKVCKVLEATVEEKDLYYLFYRRKKPTETNSGKIDNVRKFCRELFDEIVRFE